MLRLIDGGLSNDDNGVDQRREQVSERLAQIRRFQELSAQQKARAISGPDYCVFLEDTLEVLSDEYDRFC